MGLAGAVVAAEPGVPVAVALGALVAPALSVVLTAGAAPPPLASCTVRLFMVGVFAQVICHRSVDWLTTCSSLFCTPFSVHTYVTFTG